MSFNLINKETYNSISKDWESKRQFYWKPVTQFLSQVTNKQNLLDLGCGGGRHLDLAIELGYNKENCIGCDFSEGQLETVKTKGYNTILSDLTKLNIPDKSYDVIICIAAHHHLLIKEDQLTSLKEMRRVLNDSGQILLCNWFPQKEYIEKQVKKGKFKFIEDQTVKVTYTNDNGNKYDRYYYLFEEDELKNIIQQSGFDITNIEYLNGNCYMSLI